MTHNKTFATIVNKVRYLLLAEYVFPEVAIRVSSTLATNLVEGRYGTNADMASFASMLTADLRELSGDQHLRVRYDETAHVELTYEQRVHEQNDRVAHCAAMNFGIERVERLQGNIGYVDIREFVELALAGPTLTAAMNLVASTDALIVDLRQCVGGDPATVAWCSSYLFDKRVQLSALVMRDPSVSEQYWTSDWVPGPRFGQTKPVFVLTANFTFSGAEAFAYDLQSYGRARVVGETTGGGAHACNLHWLDAHFNFLLPGCRAVSPITHSNWEAVGVAPNVKCDAKDALTEAQALAVGKA